MNSLRSQLLDTLLAVTSLLQSDTERDLTERGLTPARMHLLWVLRDGAPWTQHALAAELRVTPRNVTGLVDGLESTGFVVRQQHPTDRRSIIVALTEKGGQVLTEVEAERATLEGQLVTGLSETQLQSIVDGLGTVTATLQRLIDEHEGRRPT